MMELVAPGVAKLNLMPRDVLATHLRACCGSSHWVEEMIARRPFTSPEAVLSASDEVCRTFSREDWLEAFAHHPRLGESAAAVAQDDRARDWSRREQEGLDAAGAEVREGLATANAAYERKFGYICIICATGKDPEEMLAITRARLDNTPRIELRLAAQEQRSITRLRLQKLFLALGEDDQR